MLRFFLLIALFSPSVFAKGLSPYLPMQISPEIESLIEKVMALTDGAPLTKPYKAKELLRRNEALKSSHPFLYQRISSYLSRYKKTYGKTHLNISASLSGDTKKTLPNQRNIGSDASFQLATGGFAFVSPYFYASTGAILAESNGVTHINSHVGFGYEYAQVELGYREHWFSPFQDSAMLVSTQAKPSPSITISNSTPITDWNLRYEVFYSKLKTTEGIRLGDEVFSGKPSHAGLHISFTPFDFWTLGINRTLQFGGGKRDVDINDVFEALLDPAGKDNVDNQDDPNYEFGNQQASITSKWNFTLGTPISLYLEFAGEDTVNKSNFNLGNQSKSVGIYFPALTPDLSVRYEFSDWSTAWYVHHLYANGYTNDGQIMGHWGATQRTFGHDTPATAHSFNLNWNMQENQLLDINLRTIKNKEHLTLNYKTGYELNLRYSYATRAGFWGAELYLGEDVFGESFNRITAFYRW